MEIVRIIDGKEITITLTNSELYDAKKEAEISEIKDMIIDRFENYDPMYDHQVEECADEVHTSVYCDEYIWQGYDELMDEEIDRCMNERGLI